MTSILQELEPGSTANTSRLYGGTRNPRRFNSELPRGDCLIFGANAVARARSVVGVVKTPGHHALHFYDRGNALLSESEAQNHVVYLGAETHPIQPFVPFVVCLSHGVQQTMRRIPNERKHTAKRGNLTARERNYAC